MKAKLLFLLNIIITSSLSAQLTFPYPQMVPDTFMQPGFYSYVDGDAFPSEMRDARTTYSNMIDNAPADLLFERRTFTGSRMFDQESGSTQTLDYDIMVPPDTAVAPPGGFPLVFTTYGRQDLAEAMALDDFRENYPAYVVSFIHAARPGPLHAPPVYLDYALLFHEAFDYFFDTFNIDTNRVYGSGWSRGGSSMSILEHARPARKLITAAVPSAGGFQNLLGPIEDLLHIKWFSLQGANDGNSNPRGSQHAFDQLEKAGALDNIFWWVADAGHTPHKLGWKVADIVEWMFAQTQDDLPLRPEATITNDITDQKVPFTFNYDASGSTANNGGSIVGYQWQLIKSAEAIADYSNRYLHGYDLDTGFFNAPVIGSDPTVQYTIDEPGEYWIRVIVSDDDGNRRATT